MIDDYDANEKEISVHLKPYKNHFNEMINIRKFETQYDV